MACHWGPWPVNTNPIPFALGDLVNLTLSFVTVSASCDSEEAENAAFHGQMERCSLSVNARSPNISLGCSARFFQDTHPEPLLVASLIAH